jgi:hypothetical protein
MNKKQQELIEQFKSKHTENFMLYKVKHSIEFHIESVLDEANNRNVDGFNMWEGILPPMIHSDLIKLYESLRLSRDDKS